MFSFPTEKILEKEQRQIFLRRLFRRVFFDDWLIKVFALIITFSLWFGVTGIRETIKTPLNNVTLKPRISSDYEITNSPVSEVDIVVSGDKRKIEPIKSENLVVSFDLTNAHEGEHVVNLTPESVNVELPTGVRIEEIRPNKIAIKLERVVEREVTVKPEIDGNVPDGYEIYAVNVLPQKVRVRGPESFTRSLDFVSTDKISVENHMGDFRVQQVPLNIVNPKVTLLDAVVDVNFSIGERRIERLFIVPVQNEQGETDNKTVTIVLYGAQSLLNNLHRDNLQVRMVQNQTGEEFVNLTLPAVLQGKLEIRRPKADKLIVSYN